MAFNADRKVIIKTIQTMNQHLPSKRKTLTELLEEEKPGIRGKDNTFYIMDRKELELISQNVPRYYWNRIRLPLLIEMSPDLGSGSARVQGEVESELVSKLLGLKNRTGKFIVIYLPDVRELRHKLPTTSQYAFVTTLRDNY